MMSQRATASQEIRTLSLLQAVACCTVTSATRASAPLRRRRWAAASGRSLASRCHIEATHWSAALTISVAASALSTQTCTAALPSRTRRLWRPRRPRPPPPAPSPLTRLMSPWLRPPRKANSQRHCWAAGLPGCGCSATEELLQWLGGQQGVQPPVGTEIKTQGQSAAVNFDLLVTSQGHFRLFHQARFAARGWGDNITDGRKLFHSIVGNQQFPTAFLKGPTLFLSGRCHRPFVTSQGTSRQTAELELFQTVQWTC